MGLISLDFEDLPTLVETVGTRRLGWVELYVDVSLVESQAAYVRSERDARGIRVVSVSSMAKLSQAEDAELPEHLALIERSIRLASELEAPFATFMYGSQATLDRVAARDRFLSRVEPLVALAEDAGVTLLLENVFSRGAPGDLDSVEVTLDLFERLDADHIGLNFDPANFAIAGEDASVAYRELRHLIRYMHLKDVRALTQADEPVGDRRVFEDFTRGRFVVVPLGTGDVDVAGLIREVAEDDRGIVVALEPTAKGDARESWLDASLAFLADCDVVRSDSERDRHELGDRR
jgi:sugar phosphate isomerase/epimerase